MNAADSSQPGFFHRAYARLIAIAKLFRSPLLLILRLYWGWQFCQTGYGKLTHLGRTADFFQQLKIPWPKFNVCLAGGTEFAGGLLLLIGLGSRLVCLPLLFVTVIAYATAEADSIKHIFSDPDKFVTATPFLFMLAAAIVFAFGPGAFSVDALIERKCRNSSKSASV